jgi:hypothetical protein
MVLGMNMYIVSLCKHYIFDVCSRATVCSLTGTGILSNVLSQYLRYTVLVGFFRDLMNTVNSWENVTSYRVSECRENLVWFILSLFKAAGPHTHTHLFMYIYIYRERERARESNDVRSWLWMGNGQGFGRNPSSHISRYNSHISFYRFMKSSGTR